MKIKTFESADINVVDEEVNEFEKTHDVKATQTRSVPYNDCVMHYYTVFYVEATNKPTIVKYDKV